jgi:MFS family permease
MSATHDKDKPSVAHNEDSEPGQIGPDFTEDEIKKIRRRIDLRLLPALGLMYGISLMDRTNVSHAAIAGMFDDLDLNTGYGYSTITLIFFVSYIVFQPAMTILCRKIGPKIFLSAACLAWGVVLVGFGFVHDWRAMVGLRVIVGVFEAGFFPGAVYLLSTWYTRCKIIFLSQFATVANPASIYQMKLENGTRSSI